MKTIERHIEKKKKETATLQSTRGTNYVRPVGGLHENFARFRFINTRATHSCFIRLISLPVVYIASALEGKYLQEGPELVCQRWSEVVDFSGVLEAILKRLEIVVYLSTCPVDKSKLVRYCPQARAAGKMYQYITHFSYGFLKKKAARAARNIFKK